VSTLKLLVVAVGKARGGPEARLVQDYAGRLRWPLEMREVEERRPLPPADRTAREGRLLLDAVPAGAHVVALDGVGRTLSSEAFAAHLGRVRDGGTRAVAFLVGGADGHDAAVLDRADLVLSLGAMTWPHMLVRPMLAEQLYRAQSILDGHPYHRG
jgi:23S rRNA (pseudouridine1915-N3)-methyltransferase